MKNPIFLLIISFLIACSQEDLHYSEIEKTANEKIIDENGMARAVGYFFDENVPVALKHESDQSMLKSASKNHLYAQGYEGRTLVKTIPLSIDNNSITKIPKGQYKLHTYRYYTGIMRVYKGYCFAADVNSVGNMGFVSGNSDFTKNNNRGISYEKIGSDATHDRYRIYTYVPIAESGTGQLYYYAPDGFMKPELFSCKWWSYKAIAHRALIDGDYSRENTVSAYREAQQSEIYGTEIDVWITKDGQLVVYHDPADKNGSVITNTIYNGLVNKNGQKLPLLSEFLDAVSTTSKTRLVIDLKETNPLSVQKIVEAVQNKGVLADYYSFNSTVCKQVVRLYKEKNKEVFVTFLCWSIGDENGKLDDLSRNGVKAVGFRLGSFFEVGKRDFSQIADYINTVKRNNDGVKIQLSSIDVNSHLLSCLNSGMNVDVYVTAYSRSFATAK